jgi:hypothetical protein
VQEQLNDPQVAEKGHGGHALSTGEEAGKPGGGSSVTGPSQGTGQVGQEAWLYGGNEAEAIDVREQLCVACGTSNFVARISEAYGVNWTTASHTSPEGVRSASWNAKVFALRSQFHCLAT